MCDAAATHAARETGVPRVVLQAISLTETGRRLDGEHRAWPWTVNMEGVGKWFAGREEALAYVNAHFATGARSFDVGCFQINFRWHGNAFASIAEMFDPQINALYAARFLRRLYGETGSWSRAAGAYHSRTPQFAERYAARFDRILAELGNSAPPSAIGRAEYAHNMEVERTQGLAGLQTQTVPPPLMGSVAAISLHGSGQPLLNQPRGGLY
ncbi:transglycosylase SLT domain-containing protein [Algicella marina]|uniref:Transglycosylase SLT domain-containing protein n=1 Tax=Algicella marina TaxID=2683284 RepID=A0A6P1T823_9RHOB|nr:transglycosylase SLT domain-containing protein [Algicella marina]QHQ37449.1 transglycosylase SLT domain-containing protein [Algicella marina]